MPVERNIREILSGQAALNEADTNKRLDMLVRQGLMSQAKLPILRRGLDKLKGGKALAPNERDAVNTLMNSFMYIVLGDDTVFTRAKMHTQKNKYQSEEEHHDNPEEHDDDEYEEVLADGDNFVGEEDLTEKDIKQPKAEEPTANHPAETSTEGDTSPPTQGDSDAKDREHMCVSKMFKKDLGEGKCIPGEHAEPDADGHVEWYTVMFESGIEKVYINEDDVEVLEEAGHSHKSKKMKYEDMSKDKAGHTTGGFRISNKEADAAKSRLKKKQSAKAQVQAAARNIDEPMKVQLARRAENAKKARQQLKKEDYDLVADAAEVTSEIEEGKKRGLWDNIHAKRKSGRKMNPKGHPDAPTDAELKKAQEAYDQPAKKKPVSQMTPAEKKENDSRRKAYNEFQKQNRKEETEIEESEYSMPAEKSREETKKIKDKMKAKNKLRPKGYSEETVYTEDYKTGHKSYTDAVNHAMDHHKKGGLESSADDKAQHIGLDSKKPGKGKTTRVNLPAKDKNGKKHMVHMQVYNKGGSHPYELNTYSSTSKALQKEGAFKRMATDAEEDARLKAQKKAAKTSKNAANKEKETDPGIKEAYKKKFDAMLKKTGKSLGDMSDDEKKKFFKKVDASHTAKNESLISFDDFDLKEYITSKQVKMAKGIAFDKRHKGGDMTGAAKKMEKIKKGLSNHPGAQKALRKANEETDLEEGAYSDARRDAARDSRGLASTKKDRPDVKHDAKKDSGPEHIVPQLRKAVSIGKHVTFKDGKSHRVSQAHASKFLNKYLSSKPADKEKMQDHAHQSHKHFMKHV
tara:strand:- start:1337 stop:3736 length:2400 start_codon:yes stop_codon:yes gene_type:complete